MEIRELTFRGRPYKIAALSRYPNDASWFTFEDESTVRDRDWDVAPGDVVLDIGSGFGSYTLTALAVGAAFVHCWNPNSSENDLLAHSLAANGWSDRCLFHREGLWSRTGFLRDTDLFFTESERPDVADLFPVFSLDDRSSSMPLDRLDWMKLDVEGAELHVLRGAESLLRKFRPRVLVENHEFKDPNILPGLREFMPSLGYTELRTERHHGVSHTVWVHPA